MKRRTFTTGLLTSVASLTAAESEHEQYMRRAIAASRANTVAPFGAVIVDRERKEIVASGVNKSAQNPSWHGEIDAINNCAAAHPKIDWSRLTLYTTAEPCPMCQSAIIWARMPLVVYGTSIPYLTSLGWSQIDIRAHAVSEKAFHKTEVIGGVLEQECNALFLASPITKKRP